MICHRTRETTREHSNTSWQCSDKAIMAKVFCHSILVVVFCVLLFCRTSVAISRPTSIVLENNEYKHILVAIDDSVDDDPTLIQTIKVRAVCIIHNASRRGIGIDTLARLKRCFWLDERRQLCKCSTSRTFLKQQTGGETHTAYSTHEGLKTIL